MGQPLAGQTVFIKDSNGNNITTAVTDANGNFSVSGSISASGTFNSAFLGQSGVYNPSASAPVNETYQAPVQNTAVTLAITPNPTGGPVTFTGNLSTTP